MSCTFAPEVSTLVLEEWHDFISPWDSLTGRSPLMQVCRMINAARASLYLDPYSFHRVGTDCLDTDLAIIDYELNPTWNPVYDFAQILSQAVSQYNALTNGVYYLGTGCKKRRYFDSFPSITGNVQLVEDWQPIIQTIRSGLELMEGGNIYTEPWIEHTVLFELVPAGAGITLYSNGEGENYHYEAASLVAHAGFKGYYAKFAGADDFNAFENRDTTCFSSRYADDGGALTVRFDVGDAGYFPVTGSPTPYWQSFFPSADGTWPVTFCECESDTPATEPPTFGWWTRDKTRLNFKLKVTTSFLGSVDTSMFSGININWQASPSYFGPTPILSWTGTSSGSIPTVVGGSFNTTSVYNTDMTLTLPSSLSLPDQSVVAGINKAISFSVNITNTYLFYFCVDACGNQHLVT